MNNFPKRIRYVNTDKEIVVHSENEIDHGKPYFEMPVEIIWGRKVVVDNVPMDDE